MGRRLISLLLAGLAGVSFWAAFPDVGIWPLVLVGAGLLWLAMSAGSQTNHVILRKRSAAAESSRDAVPSPGWNALVGFVAGAVFFGPHVWWASVATALVPWVALVLLQAAFWAVLGMLWAWVLRIPWIATSPWRQALAFAILFTGVEQWRSSIPFGGFPWGRLAWSVAGATPGRAAWLGGSVLVTFLLVLAATLVATSAREVFRVRKLPDQALPGVYAPSLATSALTNLGVKLNTRLLGSSVLAIALLVLPGLLPLPRDANVPGLTEAEAIAIATPDPWSSVFPNPKRVPRVDAGIRTAQSGVLQVGIAQGNVFNPGLPPGENANAVFASHLEATEMLANDNFYRLTRSTYPEDYAPVGYDIVVWPENAAAWDPNRWPQIAAMMDAASERVGAPILIGSMEYPDTGGRYNVMLLWEAGKGSVARYAKQIPAPFGEYIPFRTFARMLTDQVDRLPIDMLAADNPPMVSWYVPRLGQTVTMGLGICFEVAYDHIFIDAVRQGAELLVIPTNNASFGVTPQSTQQLQMTQMQAITTGRAAIQISTVGVSGVFTPDGKLVARTNLWEQDRISALMPLRTSITPAVRLGMAPSYLFQALALALPLLGLVVRQRSGFYTAINNSSMDGHVTRHSARSRRILESGVSV